MSKIRLILEIPFVELPGIVMGSGLNWIVPDPQWGEPLTECPRPGHGPSLDPRIIPMSGRQSQPLETLPDAAIPGSGSGNAGPGGRYGAEML